MPLVHSGSKQALKENMRTLRAEIGLERAMANVATMLFRVTIWAKNFQVRSLIVRAVLVLVMNAKNLRHLAVPASLAIHKQTTGNHHRAHSRMVGGIPLGLNGFVVARGATVKSRLRGRPEKSASTVTTLVCYGPSIFEAFVFAFFRTIFWRGTSGSRADEGLLAVGAYPGHLDPVGQSLAASRTIFRCRGSIVADLVFRVASRAFEHNHWGFLPCR